MKSHIKKTMRHAFVGLVMTLACGITTAQAAQSMRLQTLGPGTSPYVVMTTFANIINKNLPDYSIEVNATGAATRHAVETAMGKAEFFMSSPSMLYLMKEGTGPFSKLPSARKLVKNIRTLFNFPMGYYHIVTFADSGIKSLEDIKGKRVFLGPPGGVAQQTTSLMIKAATGYEAGKDYQVVSLGWNSAAQSFQDGHIDVYFNPTLPPSPVITQIALTNKIRLLGLPKKAVQSKAMQTAMQRPGYRITDLPIQYYGDNVITDGPVRTIGVTVGLSTNKDAPADAIYKMVKTFWEHIDQRAEDTPTLRNITLDQAFIDMDQPLHPGAVRYYREIGLDIPDAILPEEAD